MDITLNDKRHIIVDGIRISDLFEELNIPHAGTAVAVNGRIIPRDDHGTYIIVKDDTVDILRPIGGG